MTLARFLSLLIAFALFGASLNLVAGCKSKSNDSDEEEAVEKQVDLAKVPAAAMDSIKKEIGDTPIKRVLQGQKRGKPYYEAKYNDPSGKRMMVQVAEDGKVYKKTEDDDPEPAAK
jgi:uncharacterized protein YpmB